MKQDYKRFGLRDEDELTAVIVVLLIAALFFWFFARGCQTDLQSAAAEGRVIVVDAALLDSVTPPPNVTVISADAAASAGIELTPVSAENLPAGSIDEAVRQEQINAEMGAPFVAATVAPTIGFAENRTFEFGGALIEGSGEPNTDVEIVVDGRAIGRSRVDANGKWSFSIPRGSLDFGTHDVVATSGELLSNATTFTLNAPQAPRFADNYENAVLPGVYRVRGTADANWKVGLRTVSDEVQLVNTDANGNWEAMLDLSQLGLYELQAIAINPDGTPNLDLATDRLQIEVVETLPVNNGGGDAPEISAETDEDGIGAGEGYPADVDGAAPDDDVEGDAPDTDTSTDTDAGTDDGTPADATDEPTDDGSAVTDDGAEEATDDGTTVTDDGTGEETDDGASVDGEEGTPVDDGTDDESDDGAAEGGAEDAYPTEDDAGADDEGDVGEDLPTMLEQLAADGRFTTLLAAVDSSGLGVTLDQQDAPVTLFAPTDEALAQLPPGALDNLLGNQAALQAVLVEHVVPGALSSADIVNFMTAEPPALTNLAGHVLPLSLDGNSVKIANSNVTEADIQVSNGYIHALDEIILPPLEGQQPVIDDSGVPIFKGSVLTVVGTAEPNTVLTLMVNNQVHGTTTVNADGTWLVTNDIASGEYKIVAYMFGDDGILRGISDPVLLTVE